MAMQEIKIALSTEELSPLPLQFFGKIIATNVVKQNAFSIAWLQYEDSLSGLRMQGRTTTVMCRVRAFES